MHTQVGILGAGPAGLLLSQLLNRAGIATVLLERRPRAHVLARIRAGVLEEGTVAALHRAGVGARIDREGLVHHGCHLAADGRMDRIDFAAAGRSVTVYGQTEVTRDLYAAQDACGTPILHGVEAVTLAGLDGDRPRLGWRRDGAAGTLDCDFVAGCDGFHGVSRRTIPAAVRREYEKVYPFAWLGLLSEAPPVADELIYARHDRGFALCSLRSPTRVRYYLQVPAGTRAEDWSDAAFWDELARRLPGAVATRLVPGPTLEKSVAALRSFVCEPMRWGRLFLCGDAAHIVPPTGAKGLNLAVADAHLLATALIDWYARGDAAGLDAYSDRALARVWQAMRFSWWMTMLLHRIPDQDPWDRRMQEAELAALLGSAAARAAMAESYCGPRL